MSVASTFVVTVVGGKAAGLHLIESEGSAEGSRTMLSLNVPGTSMQLAWSPAENSQGPWGQLAGWQSSSRACALAGPSLSGHQGE